MKNCKNIFFILLCVGFSVYSMEFNPEQFREEINDWSVDKITHELRNIIDIGEQLGHLTPEAEAKYNLLKQEKEYRKTREWQEVQLQKELKKLQDKPQPVGQLTEKILAEEAAREEERREAKNRIEATKKRLEEEKRKKEAKRKAKARKEVLERETGKLLEELDEGSKAAKKQMLEASLKNLHSALQTLSLQIS